MNTDKEIEAARQAFVSENARYYRVALKNTARRFMELFSLASTLEEQAILLDNKLMEIADDEFQVAYDKMWKRTPIHFARETYKGLTNTKAMNDIFNPVNAFKPLLQQRIGQVTITTYKNYKSKLQGIMVLTNDIKQIARMFNTSVRGAYIRLRASQIARTETTFASNVGRRAGAMATGLPIAKTWVTMGDADVRHDHSMVDGQTKQINQPFLVGGEWMMFPSDYTMGATAGNLVNCRCAEKYSIIK